MTGPLKNQSVGRARGNNMRGGRSEESGTVSSSRTAQEATTPSTLEASVQKPFNNPFAPKANPFGPTSTSSTSTTPNPFGPPSVTPSPFAAKNGGSSPFGTAAQPTSGFGGPISQAVPSNPFGSAPLAASPTTSLGGNGQSAGTFGNLAQPTSSSVFAGVSQPTTSSTFGDTSSQSALNVFGGTSTGSQGVFGSASQGTAGTFGTNSATATASTNPFGNGSASSQSKPFAGFGQFTNSSIASGPASSPAAAASNPFATSVTSFPPLDGSTSSTTTPVNPFAKPSATPFGGSSIPSTLNSATKPVNHSGPNTNPFAFGTDPQKPSSNAFGTASLPTSFPTPTSQPSSTDPAFAKAKINSTAPRASYGDNGTTGKNPPSTFSSSAPNSASSPFAVAKLPRMQVNTTGPSPNSQQDDPYAAKIAAHLKQRRVFRPKAPDVHPGDPDSKPAVEKYWQALKTYRDAARLALQEGGIIDNPNKRRALEDAIPFRGTCNTMCPYFEVFERIVEGPTAIHRLEKRPNGKGALWPSVSAMVKRHGRSAAGEDGPLPEDVRTPQMCRQTVDYLIRDIIGIDEDLRRVQPFIWDRTRCIRREFIFMSGLTRSEIGDQLYCFELIARFHIVSLHHMSKPEIGASDYNPQQEHEQLAKTLLSLKDLYKDCIAQDIECPNAPEFIACFALYHAYNSNILEDVQSWGPDLFASEELSTAVSLIEALQTISDLRGPQKPYRTTDIAHNAFTTFFDIVEDEYTSYTMACLAEIHFNRVRMSALKTVLAAFRKQRDQTKEWTVSKLNEWLRFDDDSEVVPFAEKYGLFFEQGDDGEQYLSFEGQDGVSEPHPPPAQPFSQRMVERKRGSLSLTELIEAPVYENVAETVDLISDRAGDANTGNLSSNEDEMDNEDSLFVPDNRIPTTTSTLAGQKPATFTGFQFDSKSQSQSGFAPFQSSTAQPTMISIPAVDQAKKTTGFGGEFSKLPPLSSSSSSIIPTPGLLAQTDRATSNPIPKVAFAAPAAAASSPFSFLTPAVKQPTTEAPKSTFSLSDYPVEKAQAIISTATPPLLLRDHGLSDAKPVTESTGMSSPSTSPAVPSSQPSTTPALGNMAPPPVPAAKATGALFAANATTPLLSSKTSAPQMPSVSERERKIDNFVSWYTLGAEGIIDQFTEHNLESILADAFKIVQKENLDRLAAEELAEALRFADAHRIQHIKEKYIALWRNNVHRKIVRKNRESKAKLRAEMAAAAKAKKQALSDNLVEDFRASTQSARRQQRVREGSLESLLNASIGTNSAYSPASSVRRGVDPSTNRRHSERASRGLTKIGSSRLTNPHGHSRSLQRQSVDLAASLTSASSHRGSSLDDPLRRSLADYPSALRGESRLNLTKDYASDRRQVSGVQTDYFRLKARGIHTMPDGSPLARSVAMESVLRKKRSVDELTREQDDGCSSSSVAERMREWKITRGSAESVEKPGVTSAPLPTMIDKNSEVERMKARAREVMAAFKASPGYQPALRYNSANKISTPSKSFLPVKDDESNKKRGSVDIDEEELFERVKRVKAQMDEDTAWYQSIVNNETQGLV